MRALLFGGSGMIGQGVLRELLARPEVTEVISVGRTPLEQKHQKLTDLLRKDLLDWSDVEAQLTGIDAVFFCLPEAHPRERRHQRGEVTREPVIVLSRFVATK